MIRVLPDVNESSPLAVDGFGRRSVAMDADRGDQVVALLGRALERIGRHGSPHRGIDIAAFMAIVDEVRATAERCEANGVPLPLLETRIVPRA